MAHYREAHPLAFVVTHWVNLVAMIFLIFTGFYIHYPLFGGVMTMARGLHIFFGIVLLINCLVRMVLAFFIKSAPAPGTRELVPDYKTWLTSTSCGRGSATTCSCVASTLSPRSWAFRRRSCTCSSRS